MRILITGKESFIGTNFIRYSKFRQIDEVSLLDNKPEEIDFGSYDVVLHVAAIVHQTRKIPQSHYFEVNRDLCLRTAICAKKGGIKQFVFISTLKVYGEPKDEKELRDEKSECSPSDPYGRSKLEAEMALHELEDENFVVSIIRSSVVYGEGVKANILSLINLISRFGVLPLGGINNKRNFVYIENLTGYIDAVILKRISGTFIAIDPKPLSTTEIVRMISHSLGKKLILFGLPQWTIRLCNIFFPATFGRLFGSLEFSNRETLRQLEYEIPVDSAEGIRRTVNAWRKAK